MTSHSPSFFFLLLLPPASSVGSGNSWEDVATPWGLHIHNARQRSGGMGWGRGGVGMGVLYTDMMCLTKAATGETMRRMSG